MKKDSLSKNLGLYLKYLRKKNNYNLEQIATLSELSCSYVSRLENGVCTSPSIQVLESLASAYNISLIELLNIEKSDEKTEEVPTFKELIIKNNFMFNGKKVDDYTKELLLNLIDAMIILEINHKKEMDYITKVCKLINNFTEGNKEA
ncbi:helix-turn-helix domain-containing protein [Anaerophilus nitritogenes]|uniref:helix-turn-helix domain-containing protein n=1 Tax=Anaerophilus nitritogenes TaxID=2498136 RepID=UPI0013EDB5D3|nr:helix-turn-helix transcriptional regulator [Anaerophilus nitritogenes]